MSMVLGACHFPVTEHMPDRFIVFEWCRVIVLVGFGLIVEIG
ncbi:hypothetical protein [Gracilibacillus sp. YIM 98692]|nr:hypothetical protein [Gracilibacillus sp. YIM 98692]